MSEQRRILITGGRVLSGEPGTPDLEVGDVLIEGDTISQIAPHIDAPGAEVVDATGMIVMPGLVDTHKHTWQSAIRHRCTNIDLDTYFGEMFANRGPRYTPEDVYLGNLLGVLTAIDSGTTTVMDWSHIQNSPEHSDRAIDALQDSGARAVFGHGWPLVDLGAWIFNSDLPHTADLRRIRNERLSDDDALVTLAFAGRGPELSTMAATTKDLQQARDLGIRTSIHMGCGVDRAGQRAIGQMADAGLLGPDLTFVHCSKSSDDEFRAMADHGVSLSIAPQQELTMGHIGHTPIDRARALGIVTGLSSDTEAAGAGDLFTQMRMGVAAHRLLLNEGLTTVQHPTEITTEELFDMATMGGARVLGMEDRIGSLAPGKAADLVLLRATDVNLYPVAEPKAAIVASAHSGNVDSVMIAGVFRKRGGALVGSTLDDIRERLAESHARLLAD